LTGRYAFQAGNTELSKAVTSAEVLETAGYFTAMTGKWHLKEQPTNFGFQRYWVTLVVPAIITKETRPFD